MFRVATLSAGIALALASPVAAAAAQDDINVLKDQLKKQQAQIDALADQLEQNGNASGKLAQWYDKMSIGGYGEMHYNDLEIESDSGSVDKEEIDLHRFVLYYGYAFTNTVRFYSEFEIEHTVAGEEKNGEVEIEQAYIEWDYLAKHRARAGVMLTPVGLLNLTHEPDTFYGVERNNVERNIIPATWWEGGIGLNGELAPGLNYDATITEGLKLDEDEFKVRDGRQQTSEATAGDLAYTAAVNYTGVPGLQIGGAVRYQGDVLQGEEFVAAKDLDALLYEAHVDWHAGPVGVRALYATWNIDDAIENVKAGADKQEGFYIEPSYKITEKLGVFARYSEWDNQAGGNDDTEFDQQDFGVNYWLTNTVVLKADIQNQDAPKGVETDGFNLGLGWSF